MKNTFGMQSLSCRTKILETNRQWLLANANLENKQGLSKVEKQL